MQDLIGYDEIIENSMRSVIYKTFKKIETTGLLGKHFFVITFLTNFPGIILSKPIKEKYSDEMTIVIQHQYKSLLVENDLFKVSLSFAGKYEKLVIPYKSITSFSDPSMNFGLKFSVNYEDLENEDLKNIANKNETKTEVDLSAKIISLDAFRKNKNNNNQA